MMMKKPLTTHILVLSMMMLGFALIPPLFAAGSAGTVKMVHPFTDNSSFDYNTTSSHVPFNFTMHVILEPIGTINVKGWQILVGFNATLLNFVSGILPAGHIFEGYDYQSPPPVIDNVLGTVSQMAILVFDSQNVSARTILTELTFNVTLSPTIQTPNLADAISFLKIDLPGGTYVIDFAGTKLDLNYEGGTFHYSYFIGDINGDGTVNVLDAILLGAAFGSTPSSPLWNPNADLNGDSSINILDVIVLESYYGQNYS